MEGGNGRKNKKPYPKMTLPKKFLADPDDTKKTLKWVIVFESVTTIIFIAVMVFILYKEDKPIAIDPELTKEIRKANEEHRQALRESDKEKIKIMEWIEQRDSLNKVQLAEERKYLETQRKMYYEKSNLIDRYMSADLQREFSSLDTTSIK